MAEKRGVIPRSSGLSGRIILASGVLAAVLVTVFAVLVTAVVHLRSTSDEARETDRVLAVANRVEKLVIDLETGLRGYVIARQAVFLQPYEEARRSLPASVSELERLVAHEPGQLALARTTAAAIHAYETQWAAVVIKAARHHGAAVGGLVATGNGKRRIDQIRDYFATFIRYEERVSAHRSRRSDVAGSRAVWIGIAGIGATFALILIFAAYLRWLVVIPVQRIAACARRMARGDLHTRAPVRGAGEAGQLAQDFNSMAEALESHGRQLQRQNTELQAVLDATLDGILMADAEGNIVFANRKMGQFWRDVGLRDQGTIWDRLVHLAQKTTTPEHYLPLFGRIASNPTEVIEAEFTLESSGKTFIGHTAPVTDSGDVLVGRIFLIRDVTAERQSERTKDEFIGTLSHELRTPLTSIRGYLELLFEDDAALTDQQREFLQVVDRNADRLLHVVGDLLFIAQAEAGTIAVEPAQFDLAKTARDALAAAQPAAAARDITLAYDGPSAVPMIGDSSRIAQLIDNLLSNAVKFTRPAGTVRVQVSQTQDSVVLEVKDDGEGIDPQDQERLFDRFFRTEDAMRRAVPGTGLGLSIVKAIVDSHGGSISVDSSADRGTTFRVEFPREAEERAA